MSDKKQEELDHGLIMLAMKEMAADISINFAKVETNFKVLAVKNDSEREATGLQLENILTEAKKTNGRITKNEKDTRILSFFMDNKIVFVLCLVGLYAIYNYKGLFDLLTKIF